MCSLQLEAIHLSYSLSHHRLISKLFLKLGIAAAALACFGCVARRSFTDTPQSKSSSLGSSSNKQALGMDAYADLFEASRRAKKAGKSSLDFSSSFYAPSAQSLIDTITKLDGLVKSTKASLDSDIQKKKFVAEWEEQDYSRYKSVVLDAQQQLPICRNALELQKQEPNVKSLLECAIILSLSVSEYLRNTAYRIMISSALEVFEGAAPFRFPTLVLENDGFVAEAEILKWSEMFYFVGLSPRTFVADGTYISSAGSINHDAAHIDYTHRSINKFLERSLVDDASPLEQKYGVTFPIYAMARFYPDSVSNEIREFHRQQLTFHENLIRSFRSKSKTGVCDGVRESNLVRLYFVLVHEGDYLPGNLFHMLHLVATSSRYVDEDNIYENWINTQARFEVKDVQLKKDLNKDSDDKWFELRFAPTDEEVALTKRMFPEAETKKMIQCFKRLLQESCPTCRPAKN
jgi:hypothetical protein